jgi:hypothetical protein
MARNVIPSNRTYKLETDQSGRFVRMEPMSRLTSTNTSFKLSAKTKGKFSIGPVAIPPTEVSVEFNRNRQK